MSRWNQRKRTLALLGCAALLLCAVTVAGLLFQPLAMETDFANKQLAPGPGHWFGTDWMGRDMLARTLTGLSLSIRIGLLTAVVSALLSVLLGVTAALGRRADAVISWCIDLFLGIPHILLVMLISLAFGRGFVGVVAGVSLSHWPSLARVIRGEVLQLRQTTYVRAAERLGVPAGVRSFVLPLGATLNMDGTAIYQGVCALFIANAYGIPLALPQQLTIILTCTLASVGTAGVPGAGAVMLGMVLQSVGLPVEGVALVLGIDRVLDMARTAVNVAGDLACAVVVSAAEPPVEKGPPA